MDPKKQAILDALTKFMNQRAGMDPRDYGDWKAYRAESRSVTRDLHNARTLLRAVSWRDSIDGDALEAAFRAFSGRLTLLQYKTGEDCPRTHAGGSHKSTRCSICNATGKVTSNTVRLEYCTGQYFPTEYRKAVCAVLSSALWDNVRPDIPNEGRDGKSAGDLIRGYFRREFGRGLAAAYFN